MRVVLVSGGRYYQNIDLVFKILSAYHNTYGISCIVQGDCGTIDYDTGDVLCGADLLAKCWADANEVPHRDFPANWNKYGNAAGMIRNQQMLDENPDISVLIAFKGNTGTAGMIRITKIANRKHKRNIKIFKIKDVTIHKKDVDSG